jgi:flagellar biosynthesis protein FlhA
MGGEKLLRLRAPQCAVLSISELPPSQPIEVIDVIGGEQPDLNPSQTALQPEDLAA